MSSQLSPIPLPATLQWLGEAPFVGRETERRALWARWTAACSGIRTVVLIGGEPGVGKTRMVTELAQDAHAAGATVLFGRCDEEPQIPYQPFLEAFRHLVEYLPVDVLRAHVQTSGGILSRLAPDLGARVALPPDNGDDDIGDARAVRAFAAAASLLSATSDRAPLLLVLDDLHWAATPTLLLLRHLVRSLAGRPVLIAGTYRDTELGRTHPFADTLADLRREPDIDRVALSGLDVDGVRKLIQAMRSDAAPETLTTALHEGTNGNPFLVVEMIRHLDEGSDASRLPAGAKEVIGRRLSRLSRDTDRVLASAAIVGLEFELGVLSDVVDTSEDVVLDAVDEAMRAKLVAETSRNRYSFAHALVRQTLLDELSSTRRVRLHRRVGEAIEHRHADELDEHLAALAYHFTEAAPGGDLDRAATYTLRAARQAIDQIAYESAIELTERGLATLDEVSDEPDQARRSELLLVQSMAHERMGVDERLAMEAARRAAEAARQSGSAHHLANAVWSYGRFVRVGSSGEDAADFAEEALRLLGPGEAVQRARVMAVLSIIRGFAGRRAEAQQLADEAAGLARSAGDIDTLANALISIAVSRWGTADADTMRAATDELFALGIGPEHPYLYLFGMRMRGTVQLLDVDLAGFDETIEITETVARRVSYGFFVLQAITWRAMRLLIEGKWDDADNTLAELRPMSSDPNAFMVWAGLGFIAQLERGRASYVVPLLEEALDTDQSLAVFRVGAALARLEMGDMDAAERHYAIATERGLDSVIDNWMLPVQLSWLAHVAHALDDREIAAALATRLEPYAGMPVIVASGMYISGAWDRYRGLVASVLGQHDEAVALVQAAGSIEARLRAEPHGARSDLALAQVLLRRDGAGDREQARTALERCIGRARSLDMLLLAEQAESLLRTL